MEWGRGARVQGVPRAHPGPLTLEQDQAHQVRTTPTPGPQKKSLKNQNHQPRKHPPNTILKAFFVTRLLGYVAIEPKYSRCLMFFFGVVLFIIFVIWLN